MHYIIKTLISVIFTFMFLGSIQATLGQNNESTDIENINSLEASFGDTFYKSLYSIDELRPYIIIQLEKTISDYENSWVSPDEIITHLNNKDRINLKYSLEKYLKSTEREAERKDILRKIKFWCISASQFELMINKMEISRETVIKLIIPKISAAVNSNTGEIINQGTDSNLDYQYYSLLNQISKLNIKEQLKLFSDIFSELAN